MSEITTKELFEAKLKGLKAELSSGQFIINHKLDELLKYQKETNGKVQVIYSETSFFRFIQRNPKISVLVAIILIGIIVWGVTELGIIGFLTLAK